MNETLNGVTIYGLFQGECCLYVGRTSNPKQRHAAHRCTKLRGEVFEFRVLAVVDPEDAARIELETIKEWKEKGMASLNNDRVVTNAKIVTVRLSDSLCDEAWMLSEDFDMNLSSIIRICLSFACENIRAGTHAFINGKLQAL